MARELKPNTKMAVIDAPTKPMIPATGKSEKDRNTAAVNCAGAIKMQTADKNTRRDFSIAVTNFT